MVDVPVCNEAELTNGEMRLVRSGKRELGVLRHDGRYFAYENSCPHQGGPACEGLLMPAVKDVIGENGVYTGQDYDRSEMHLVCPWHGYEFRLSDGRHAVDGDVRLRKYDAFARDGVVYVTV